METTAIGVPPFGCSPGRSTPKDAGRPVFAPRCVLVSDAAHRSVSQIILAARGAVPSGPGGRSLVHGAQALLAHVGVDLRGGQAGVPEKFLDDTQIGPTIEQVGGEGVT